MKDLEFREIAANLQTAIDAAARPSRRLSIEPKENLYHDVANLRKLLAIVADSIILLATVIQEKPGRGC